MDENRVTVLIVDDSPADRDMYKTFLATDASRKYEIHEAGTLLAGLDAAARIKPDCILLDYRLPDGDGILFLEDGSEYFARCATAVVMLTGMGDETVAVKALQAGAKDYLSKDNITAEALVRATVNAVTKARLEVTVERQQLELERSRNDLEAYASVAAHDLKSPLFKIQLMADNLVMRYADRLDDKGREMLANMKDSLKRMQAFIDALLGYAVLGRRPERFRAVSLSELAAEVASDLDAVLEKRGARLNLDPSLNEKLEADPTLIKQLLQNLVENALKYSREDVAPELTIRCVVPARGELPSPAKKLELRVEDNGIGFDEEQLPQIFRPFQRLHRDDRYGGVGIGLATCRKIAEYHQGSITARSRPGRGTAFIITLPAAQSEPAAGSPVARRAPSPLAS